MLIICNQRQFLHNLLFWLISLQLKTLFYPTAQYRCAALTVTYFVVPLAYVQQSCNQFSSSGSRQTKLKPDCNRSVQ